MADKLSKIWNDNLQKLDGNSDQILAAVIKGAIWISLALFWIFFSVNWLPFSTGINWVISLLALGVTSIALVRLRMKEKAIETLPAPSLAKAPSTPSSTSDGQSEEVDNTAPEQWVTEVTSDVGGVTDEVNPPPRRRQYIPREVRRLLADDERVQHVVHLSPAYMIPQGGLLLATLITWIIVDSRGDSPDGIAYLAMSLALVVAFVFPVVALLRIAAENRVQAQHWLVTIAVLGIFALAIWLVEGLRDFVWSFVTTVSGWVVSFFEWVWLDPFRITGMAVLATLIQLIARIVRWWVNPCYVTDKSRLIIPVSITPRRYNTAELRHVTGESFAPWKIIPAISLLNYDGWSLPWGPLTVEDPGEEQQVRVIKWASSRLANIVTSM